MTSKLGKIGNFSWVDNYTSPPVKIRRALWDAECACASGDWVKLSGLVKTLQEDLNVSYPDDRFCLDDDFHQRLRKVCDCLYEAMK